MRSGILRRLLLSSLQYFFFACGGSIDDVVEAGPLLVISPHPDDETLGCGAVVARARAAGQSVRIIIVTDGRASARSTVYSSDALAELRRAEARKAALALGVAPDELIFLNFRDGEAERHVDGIAAALLAQIEDFAPANIFACHQADGHADHRAVAAAVERLRETGAITCPVYDYPIWFWPHFALKYLVRPRMLMRLRHVDARPGLARKKAAMAEYRSQSENLTGEKDWFVLPPAYLVRFFRPYELFIERAQPAARSVPITEAPPRPEAGEFLPGAPHPVDEGRQTPLRAGHRLRP